MSPLIWASKSHRNLDNVAYKHGCMHEIHVDYSAEANSPLKEPALLVLKLMCNWASSSHTLQLRIIGSGLLFASLSSVQHLLPYLQQEDEVFYSIT